ncbi:hypothetical protein KLP28_05665 [Nocardioidaceae bacterium]|nr:hypothetical protein KLP28_05665 [Nocardioidaceae bacterium]
MGGTLPRLGHDRRHVVVAGRVGTRYPTRTAQEAPCRTRATTNSRRPASRGTRSRSGSSRRCRTTSPTPPRRTRTASPRRRTRPRATQRTQRTQRTQGTQRTRRSELTAAPDVTTRRCAEVSAAAGEQLGGSASAWNACLLIEQDGPWGPKVLRDTRLPAAVRDHLDLEGLRVLLIRRHGRTGRDQGAQGVRVMASWSGPEMSWLERRTLADLDELLTVDLAGLVRGERPGWQPVEEPVVLVCTHGRRDVCCAERGRPVAAALATHDPEGTWECSHVGGHRFAPNVVLLPAGLAYGRVEAGEAVALREAYASGQLLTERLRGRVWQQPAAQAAEVAIRQRLGLTGVDDVDAAVREVAPGATTVTLEIRAGQSAGRWAVEVQQHTLEDEAGPVGVLSSCGDADTSRASSWQVGPLRQA